MTEDRRCPHCGATLDEDAERCAECGQDPRSVSFTEGGKGGDEWHAEVVRPPKKGE